MEPLAANELNEIGKKLYDQKSFGAAAAIFEIAVTDIQILKTFYLIISF